MKCEICQKAFKASLKNPNLINGFRCMDTGFFIHTTCKTAYYTKKNAGEFGAQHKSKYSEFPISILTIQPQLPLL